MGSHALCPKAHGATIYDLWGIPYASAEELEEQFTQRSDGLWGVYRFKRGLVGEVVRSVPAYVSGLQAAFCIVSTKKNSSWKNGRLKMIRLEEDQIPDWNQLLLQFPDAHILQTSQWAEAKKQNGWSPMYFREGSDPEAPVGTCPDLTAERYPWQVEIQRALMCPKGPVLHWEDQSGGVAHV